MLGINIFSSISAIIYFLLGLAFLINPSGMANSVGFKNLSSEAVIDIRATYGGFLLSIGCLLSYWTYIGELKVSLTFISVSFLGFFLGRLIGLILATAEYGDHLYWALFELLYFLLSIYFYNKIK